MMSKWSLPALLLGCVAMVGCGGGDPNARPTAPVKVTVTMNGTPVPDATVSFVTDQDPVPAYGRTDASGVAIMKTYSEGDGAVLGVHKVIIIKAELVGNAPTVADVDSEAYDPNVDKAPKQEVKNIIPPKYNSPATSGLTAEVKSGQNEFTFDLK